MKRRIRAGWVTGFQLLWVMGLAAMYLMHSDLGTGNVVIGAMSAAGGTFLAVFAHELAHAVAAKRVGLRVDFIDVRNLLAARVVRQSTDNRRNSLIVALAGPVASFALLLLSLPLTLRAAAPVSAASIAVTLVSLIGVLNMIPISGVTDGAKALAAWRGTGHESGHRSDGLQPIPAPRKL